MGVAFGVELQAAPFEGFRGRVGGSDELLRLIQYELELNLGSGAEVEGELGDEVLSQPLAALVEL